MMRQYEMYELVYTGETPKGSYVDVDLSAEFLCNGKRTKAKGFYAGENCYKIRFLPDQAGTYSYQVSGIIKDQGEVICESAAEGRHGLVKPEGTHFQYADGTWYYPFGTTVYALVHQEEQLVDRTMETLKQSGFNKIRMCVFPKDYAYNKNEPPYYAFEKKCDGWDTEHPSFEFWDMLETRIRELDVMGIQCDLILFHPYDRWGFSKLSEEEAYTYLDYAVRRLSAFPNIWWSLANEYELLGWPVERWEGFASFIHDNESAHHLLSNHNIFIGWDFSNKDTTHICMQIGGSVDEINKTIACYEKPMMVDECRYEGNIPLDWGNISGFEMVNRFWKVVTQGGYCTHGETYLNDEGILWWSRGGELVGESPKRIGFLKELVESLPGPLTYAGINWTAEKIEEFRKNPPEKLVGTVFYDMIKEVPDGAVMGMVEGKKPYLGTYKDEIYLKYYERDCTTMGDLDLPENEAYDVWAVDAWEMTQTKMLSSVSGHVQIPLPGKEGTAVLARKVKNSEQI